MSILHLDIETIPCQDPGYIAECYAHIKPPGNFSKPESIDKWLTENREAEADKMHRKTSFDGALGEIISIAWAVDDGDINVNYRSGNSEEELLIEFFNGLETLRDENGNRIVITTWAGHYISGFDLRFLWQRCVILGIKPTIKIPYDERPWDHHVFDTHTTWAGGSSRYTGVGSLDALAKAFGLLGKVGGLDGSKVYDYWLAGRIEEIAEYNKQDVVMCRELYRRMTFSEVCDDDF